MSNWYDDEKRRRRNKDVLEDGESIRVTAMMMDHRRPHLDASRMTLGDIAKLGELPSGIPTAYVETLKPIAQALRSVSSRRAALEIKHQIQIEHTRITTRIETMEANARFGTYGPRGTESIREELDGARAALTYLETVHGTLEGATAGLRDAMAQADQDRADAYADAAREAYLDETRNAFRLAGVPMKDRAAPLSGLDRAAQMAGVKLKDHAAPADDLERAARLSGVRLKK